MFFNVHAKDYSAIITRIAADIRGRSFLVFGRKQHGSDIGRDTLKVQVMRSGATVRARPEFSAP